MKKVTFQKIADELGVSKGLVSLALRNKYGVNESMRAKIVLKAIEMGYVFEESKKKARAVSLLVKNMGVLNEEFWRECVFGVESECTRQNVLFNITSWTNFVDADDVTMKLLSEKSDGIIVVNQCSDPVVEKITKLNMPIVFVDMVNFSSAPADNVMANNFSAGLKAVHALLDKGHRDIILAGNVDYSYSFLQRYNGCMKAVKRAIRQGQEIRLTQIVNLEKNNLVEGVYQNDETDLCNDSAIEATLSKANRPTAIVCFNDGILRRVMAIVKRLNLRVPEDLSIVSIDNTEYAREREITSVDIPKNQLGVQAVRILMDRLNGGRGNSMNIELSVSLQERSSVKEIEQ